MNGKCAKRIQHAASCFGGDVRLLKKQYKAKPYHVRKNKPNEPHSKILKRRHAVKELQVFARPSVRADFIKMVGALNNISDAISLEGLI